MNNPLHLTPEDLQYMEDKVIEWNVLFGNNPDDESLIDTYKNLCLEELNEMLEAEKVGNDGEYLDGLVDSVYTGFMLNRLVEGEGYDRNWFEDSYDLKLIASLEDMLSYLKHDDICSYTTELPVMLHHYSDKFDILGAFNRVTKSNFSKAIKRTENVDIAKEIAYIKSQGRYADVFAEDKGKYIILRAKKDLKEGKDYPKGKIMKASTYKSPEDLGGLEEFVK